MIYYRLKDNVEYPNRWYLGDILDVNNWDLASDVPEIDRELEIELYQDGEEMDFTLSEVYGIPVVSRKVKKELECYSEVRFIPLLLEGVESGQYFAMVTKSVVECVDEESSEFQKFEINDPVRPDKAGDYRAFMVLRLNQNNIGDVNIFRLKKFETAIIVSERVRNKLEAIGVTGMDLSPVV